MLSHTFGASRTVRPRARPRAAGDRAGQAGQALAELALVVSLMVVMALSLFDIGRAVHAYLAVIQGSRDGARVAMVAGTSDAQVTAAAQSAASPLSPSVSIVRSASTVSVTVSYAYQPINPLIGALLGGGSLPLTSTMVSQ